MYRLGVKNIIKQQVDYVCILKEIIEKLVKSHQIEWILERCEAEEEKGKIYADVVRNRKSMKPYLDLIKQYLDNRIAD